MSPNPIDSLPPFLSLTHAREIVAVYADMALQAGVRRKRRLAAAEVGADLPYFLQVEWDLSQPQMAILHTFYEETLEAGSLPFTVDVAALGPGLESAVAVWYEPYIAAPDVTGRWIVTGKLLVGGRAPDITFIESGASQPIYPKRRPGRTQAPGLLFPPAPPAPPPPPPPPPAPPPPAPAVNGWNPDNDTGTGTFSGIGGEPTRFVQFTAGTNTVVSRQSRNSGKRAVNIGSFGDTAYFDPGSFFEFGLTSENPPTVSVSSVGYAYHQVRLPIVGSPDSDIYYFYRAFYELGSPGIPTAFPIRLASGVSPPDGGDGYVMFAVDFDLGKIWVGQNSFWVGDPVAGTGEMFTFTPGTTLYASASTGGTTFLLNFEIDDTCTVGPAPTGFTPWAS